MSYPQCISTRKMHQTTVRFSAELWETLEEECARIGVSVAQFLREAAITRIAYAAGRRGDAQYETALDVAAAGTADAEARANAEALEALESLAGTVDRSADVIDRSLADFSEASALAAQGRQARQRSRELRDRINRHRRA